MNDDELDLIELEKEVEAVFTAHLLNIPPYLLPQMPWLLPMEVK